MVEIGGSKVGGGYYTNNAFTSKDELIDSLKTKFFKVDDSNIRQGKTEAGITAWGVSVFDEVDGVIKKYNLMFYTDEDGNAYWGDREPKATSPPREPSFIERVNDFIAEKIVDGTIKFGYIEEVLEQAKKALVSAIMPDNNVKKAIVTEAEDGFEIEIV